VIQVATKTRTRRTYTEAERTEIKAQRAAIVAQLDGFEIEPDSATEIAFERLTERYSERNSMLILIQCPATFGDVKAMSKWNEDGRKVRKGAKSILILAPAGDRKADVEIDEKPADAKPGTTPQRKRFVWVRVFDRSQTEPLPANWGRKLTAAEAKAEAAALQAHADECEAETPAAAPVEPSRTAALDDFLS
jgi:hypothetical protein